MRMAIPFLLMLPACANHQTPEPEMHIPATFSIVAYDPDTGDLGVATASKFVSVGAVVPWAKAGVGAIAAQAWANTSFGPRGLDMLAQGKDSQEVLDALLKDDDGREKRQVGIVNAKGKAVTYTGKKCPDWAGGLAEENFACQGNILAGEKVVQAMAEGFKKAKGDLGARLIAALEAGEAAGGDKRAPDVYAAALLVVREKGGFLGFNDRYRDVRVDDHKDPIKELKRLYALHKKYFPEEKRKK